MPSFSKTVIADSGFWYALYEPRDPYHAEAVQRDGILNTTNILLPWPCLYETVNTRFAKNRIAMRSFELFLHQPHVILFKDEPYKDAALDATFKSSLTGNRAISLVDMVLRLIIEDVNVRKHGILTFNPGDFADLCRKFRIEML